MFYFSHCSVFTVSKLKQKSQVIFSDNDNLEAKEPLIRQDKPFPAKNQKQNPSEPWTRTSELEIPPGFLPAELWECVTFCPIILSRPVVVVMVRTVYPANKNHNMDPHDREHVYNLF